MWIEFQRTRDTTIPPVDKACPSRQGSGLRLARSAGERFGGSPQWQRRLVCPPLPLGFTCGLPLLSFRSHTLQVRQGEGWGVSSGSLGSWSCWPRTIWLNELPSLEGWGWSVAGPQSVGDPGGEEDARSGFAGHRIPPGRRCPWLPSIPAGLSPSHRHGSAVSCKSCGQRGPVHWISSSCPLGNLCPTGRWVSQLGARRACPALPGSRRAQLLRVPGTLPGPGQPSGCGSCLGSVIAGKGERVTGPGGGRAAVSEPRLGAVPGSSCVVSLGHLPERVLGVEACPAVEPAAPVLC